MPSVGEVFRLYGDEYLGKFGDAMPAVHVRALETLRACRTGELGTAFWHCDSCGAEHITNRSCGNRHCPLCQHAKAEKWLSRQLERLLPCDYFLVTFTVPEEMRSFMRSNQRLCYAAMFDAASEALKKLGRDERFIGSREMGFLGVLQTWGDLLQFHPHLHFLVPAGALASDGTWIEARRKFLMRVEPLSKIYRAKFRDAMKDAGVYGEIPPCVWTRGWNSDVQPVGSGEHAMRYVGRYVFRVAISNSRIVSCDDHRVVFTYEDKDGRTKPCSVDALEFIRRFLQHVLPKGFVKVRHFGFLNHNSRRSIEELRKSIEAATGTKSEGTVKGAEAGTSTHTVPPCPKCGKPMRLIAITRLPLKGTG
jgi:hypothetical protein